MVVLLVLLLAGSVGGYEIGRSANALQTRLAADFRVGQAELDSAKTALKEATKGSSTTQIDVASAHIGKARVAFGRARSDVSRVPFLKQATSAPYVGARLDAALGLSDMGVALCDAADQAATIDRAMLTKTPGTSGGTSLITLLKVVEPRLAAVRLDLERASKAAIGVDISVLPAAQRPALTHARDSISTGLVSLDEFQGLIPVLYEVLGANGPRNYLLEQLNPAELRPGGGFMGTYTLLHVENGSTSVLKTGATDALNSPRPFAGQRGYVVPPGPIHDFLGNASWTLQDSNYSPSFVDNSKTALDFAKADFSVPVDGVIAMDFYTVVDLLTLTGPISVPGASRTVDANNFVQTIIDLGDFGNAGTPAKQLVSALGGPLMQHITAVSPQQLPQLLALLNKSATARHLQAYFGNQSVEDAMGRFGWSGALNPTGAGDFMVEVEGNYGGTKANFYLTRTFDLTLSLADSKLHHHLVVTLVNKTPSAYPSNYACYARLFVPSSLPEPALSGLRAPRFPDTTTTAGFKQVGGWVYANVSSRTGQGTAQMSFDYDTPWVTVKDGEHSMYIQKQAGTVADAINVTWNDVSGTSKASGTLAHDIVILLAVNKVTIVAGQAGSAHLPSLTL